MAAGGEPLLQARAVSKAFGRLQANDRVSLDIRCGSIHALIGENGAGKSTLVSMLCGAAQMDGGELLWRGRPATINTPAAAKRMGIGVVFQHFALVDQLSVAENIALGMDGGTAKQITAPLLAMADKYGLAVAPLRRVGELSAGEKQRVEILRCLLQKPQLLILDEPTSVLTPAESEGLFALLRTLAAENRGVLFISHKLNEVCELCDTASVLRRGRAVAAGIDPRRTGREQLIRLMLGGEDVQPPPADARDSEATAIAPPVLQVCGLSLPSALPKPLRVNNLSLRAGVITGVAGIAGNGQDALLDCLSGEIPVAEDMILLDGKPVGGWSCRRRARAGILATPTERHGRAAVGELSLADNGLLGMAKAGGRVRCGFVRPKAVHAFAAEVIEAFSVRAESPRMPAASLSGGNLQKFILGRALLQQPRVLLAANPTWGVDVQSASFIRGAIRELRRRGGAALVLSEDLDELLSLCDEIAVINGGVLSPPLRREEATIGEIGARMARGNIQDSACGGAAE
ncbi:MAG: ABC transporter ATP-binding protein [Gammaproteobacteria bacterium]